MEPIPNSNSYSVQSLYNIVVAIGTPTANNKINLGSGFIVNYKDRYLLLTADHVATETTDRTIIIFYNGTQKGIELNLTAITKRHFLAHSVADLSILELNEQMMGREFLELRSVPYDLLRTNNPLLSPNVLLHFLGYPFLSAGLFHFAPVVLKTYFSSIAMQVNLQEKPGKLQFGMLLHSPTMRGMSGGPVISFASTDGQAHDEATLIEGMVSGNADTGNPVTLGVVTPLWYLKDFDLEKWEIKGG